jgi:starch synthase
MSLENAKVLYISQHITPFLEATEMSTTARELPQGILERGNEIRVFMPKFGSINERRHQLHEVIRLSGMNLIIDDTDHALMIKVASIPSARMQVYFIDNEEYFKRKHVLANAKGEFFKDNDERALFFCRGALETVRKLGWVPDIIHCHGWMSSFAPMYVKQLFGDDPHFENSKVIVSVYNEEKEALDKKLSKKLDNEGFNGDVATLLKSPSTDALYQLALANADGVVKGSPKLSKSLEKIVEESGLPCMEFVEEEERIEASSEFYASIAEEIPA